MIFTNYTYHLLGNNVCKIFDLRDNKALLSRWFSLHGVTRVEDMVYTIFSVWWHKLNGIKFDFSTYSEGSTAFAKAMLAARKRYKAAPPAIFALRKNNEIRTFI